MCRQYDVGRAISPRGLQLVAAATIGSSLSRALADGGDGDAGDGDGDLCAVVGALSESCEADTGTEMEQVCRDLLEAAAVQGTACVDAVTA